MNNGVTEVHRSEQVDIYTFTDEDAMLAGGVSGGVQERVNGVSYASPYQPWRDVTIHGNMSYYGLYRPRA